MGSARALSKKKGYHHGDLPRALVAAALSLIEKRGPEGLTLREAAASVGVTHGAAYRHFEDKAALLAAVAEEGYRALAQRLAKARATAVGDARARLRALAAAYVEFAMDHPAHYRVMSGPRLNEDDRFPSLEAAVNEVFAFVLAEIERGQSEGAVRAGPAADLAVGIWIAAHGYVELVLGRRIKVKSARAKAYFERLLEPFLEGMAEPTSTRRTGRA